MTSDETLSPKLVLLPGLDGIGKLFVEFLMALDLGSSAQVVSYPPDIPLGYDELEPLVRAALPTRGRFVILGESFSGPLAIRIAAHPPPALVGLILCVTFASNPYPHLAWARGLAALLPLKSLPRWLRAPLMWGSASPSKAPRQSERAMAGVDAAVIRRRIAALLSVDETAALAKILGADFGVVRNWRPCDFQGRLDEAHARHPSCAAARYRRTASVAEDPPQRMCGRGAQLYSRR
jgi:pimeloyl-[acyl-carrier protein] methyl ester esterase